LAEEKPIVDRHAIPRSVVPLAEGLQPLVASLFSFPLLFPSGSITSTRAKRTYLNIGISLITGPSQAASIVAFGWFSILAEWKVEEEP